ncbi:MAG: LCP family protein [Candidatus Faecousia sp.]|nr:LCP family protein [Candidatus Faecousia sp.]
METTSPRKNLETILVMGLDKNERSEMLEGYVNKTQSDFLLLLVIDQENRSINSLQINRDTMTEITRLGVFGGATGKYTAQIALAHAYGSGGSDSALNAVKAVSNFLGGVKIDHYMTFTMDSVALVNDMVGGVTVFIEDDFSEMDPSLVQGQEITLKGEQALHFVRGRTNVADGTNLNRMARQRQYMMGLYEKIMAAAAQDEAFPEKLVKKLADAFDTDLSVYQLDSLFDTLLECKMGEILTIEGENVRGEFMEFYADPDSVAQAVQTLFGS